MEGKKLLKN